MCVTKPVVISAAAAAAAATVKQHSVVKEHNPVATRLLQDLTQTFVDSTMATKTDNESKNK